MKRRLLKVALLLFAGAIVNVAVAWHASLRSGRDIKLMSSLVAYGNALLTEGNPCQYTATGFTLESIWTELGPVHDTLGPWETPTRVLTGWPLRSMECSIVGSGGESHPIQHGLQTRWQINSNILVQRALPLCPLWPGFAINTVFYALVLWLLFAAPFQLRRWRRIKHGLCPACAYPIGTSEKCTECGKPVRTRSVEPVT